jgi:hypothetical protein
MQCVTLSPRSRLSHPLPLCAGKTADVLTRTRPPNNPTARRGPLCRTAVVRAPRGTSSHTAIRSLDAGPEQNERTNARTQTWSRSRGRAVCVLRGSVCPAASNWMDGAASSSPCDPLWSNHPAGSIDPAGYKYRGFISPRGRSTYQSTILSNIDRSQSVSCRDEN